jgi:hypothetical protein
MADTDGLLTNELVEELKALVDRHGLVCIVTALTCIAELSDHDSHILYEAAIRLKAPRKR